MDIAAFILGSIGAIFGPYATWRTWQISKLSRQQNALNSFTEQWRKAQNEVEIAPPDHFHQVHKQLNRTAIDICQRADTDDLDSEKIRLYFGKYFRDILDNREYYQHMEDDQKALIGKYASPQSD